MKTRVTMDCIACGRCVDICPGVFEMGEEISRAKHSTMDPECQEAVREAALECPIKAIVIEK